MSDNYRNANQTIPFLRQTDDYALGVELGLEVLGPMLMGERVISGYWCTENEEQIRLCCYRMGYDLVDLKICRRNKRLTGCIWMVLVKRRRKRRG